jgi:hypothetical protein
MKRSILKSLCLAAAVFAVPARLLAVWPPSTVFEEEAAASTAGPQTEELSPALQSDVQKAAAKLDQDERRLEQLIQQLKEDEAALKKASNKNS